MPRPGEALGALMEALEPQAAALGSGEDRVAASVAISLRRIADCLDGTAMAVDVSESLAALAHAFIYGRNQ